MIHTSEKEVQITLPSDEPEKAVKELRSAVTEVCSILITSDEFHYHKDLPEALVALIRLQEHLNR